MALKDHSGKLIASVGAIVTASLLYFVPIFEGTVHHTYKDSGGILTACTGHTGKDVVAGRKYTPQECEKFLINDLVSHAEGVKKCIKPKLTDGQLAASVSLAFNVGVPKFCNSTAAKLFNQGRFLEACAQFDRWVYADGQKLKGLVTRRAYERALCEGRKK